uniref:Cytochrome c oxidase subunit 2 n=1 Tax=Schistosoma spindalis TaxID=6189 RepID=Q1I0M4_SCHSI|nr:cytochrome c oxidase subunit II [Schistosoma spindale]AAZ57331.1 cytochrome c oxidase subunit II [Schistosoma spindale]
MNYSVLVYYDLILYVLALSLFIPLWCVIVLCYQVFESLMVSIVLPNEASILEFVWTLVPTFLVLILCFFNLNYLTYYGAFNVTVPVKIIGHQWYWTYELSESIKYDSFMTDLVSGVNKPLRIYLNVPYSLLLTSADVIHSFSIPDLSLKVDAIPGRINCLNVIFDRLGVFSGYCSQLCGVGHSYMPIVIEVIMSSSVKGA